MARALKHLIDLSQDDKIRLLAEERERQQLIVEGQKASAWDAGEQVGRKKGHAEGHAEGRFEEQKKIALSMIKDGFNIKVICRHSGLSQEEIKKLKK